MQTTTSPRIEQVILHIMIKIRENDDVIEQAQHTELNFRENDS